ncbi:MAG: ABC transporter substrate-binding protein, partial [Solirubrobacteraceae bacterium]|nr:ABC transporter substrate-binding protein [Patulibacter sp.]
PRAAAVDPRATRRVAGRRMCAPVFPPNPSTARRLAPGPTQEHPPTMHLSPLRSAAALAAATLVTGLAACGGDDSTDAAKAAPGAPKAPATLTIGYQAIPNGDLVVKHEQWLEKALPNTKIEWKAFDSGGDVNEAIAAGSLDIGLAGSSPVSRGLSQPLAYQVPWIHDVIGSAEALVVKKDITSIDQLVGKKIATPLASTSHYSLLAALQDAGVDQSKVKVIDAEPDDIYAAWSRGDIDGAYVWNPNLDKIVKDGGHVLVDSSQLAKKGKTTYDLAVASNDFAKTYPAALQTWVEQENKAVELYRSNKTQWATDVGAELNLDVADVEKQAAGLIFLDAKEQIGADYLGGGLATNLFAAAQFNQKLGQIPSVKPEADYKAAVNAAPATAVAGQ